ncbi:MAG TPA: type VI secretion system tube protein Hcp [Acidimicrobiales bacterium]|nr:type VI secretion system tube protein Hcp [Acidimicrobiales bacterium]
MAIDVFAIFTQADGTVIGGESQVNLTLPGSLGGGTASQAIQLASFSLEVENSLNIGSATSGAGAGKAKFDPITVTRNIDVASPALFQLCASGTHLKQVDFVVSQSGGSGGQKPFLRFTFSTVFVQNITWNASAGGDAPQETLNLEYGQMEMTFLNSQTNSAPTAGWSQITNSAGPTNAPTPLAS